MTKRTKRHLIRFAGLTAFVAVALLLLAWERRRQDTLAASQTLDGSGLALSAEDQMRKYSDPVELAKLCDRVRERFAAMHERTLRSQHTRTMRLTEQNGRGQAVHIREMVERVEFEDGQEKTQLIEQRVLLDSATSFLPNKTNLSNPADNPHRPFPNEAGQDVYAYRFDGVEEIEKRPAGRIHFEPRTTDGQVSRGWAWVDLDSGEPIRLQVSPVKPPPFVDRLDVLIDYGRAENGHNQARRVTLDGSGGFAFLARRLRVECTLSDYREQGK
jgi:hypothetical protein